MPNPATSFLHKFLNYFLYERQSIYIWMKLTAEQTKPSKSVDSSQARKLGGTQDGRTATPHLLKQHKVNNIHSELAE